MIYLASLQEETRDKVDGYIIIHTKSELDRIIVKNTEFNKVIIRNDFAQEFFTPSGLVTYCENVKRLNPNVILELETENIMTRNKFIDKIAHCRDAEEIVMLLSKYEKEFMDTLRYLIESNTTDFKKMLAYSNQVSRLQSIIENMQVQLQEKNDNLNVEISNKLSYQSKFHALISRINYQYDLGINPNKIFTVDGNSYDKILYIKEITRVQYTDSLVYYLKEILKTLYSMPTRIVVIENYYAESKVPLYPELVPHYRLIERDVIKGDILMLGMQPNIMQDILKNASNISILIILDRGGYITPHITGDNVEVLYTVSDLKDIPYGIPYGRVISYSEQTQFIKYIKGFDKLDAYDKIHEYSSMNIVKNIVELMERK